jgi:hypothetical protein
LICAGCHPHPRADPATTERIRETGRQRISWSCGRRSVGIVELDAIIPTSLGADLVPSDSQATPIVCAAAELLSLSRAGPSRRPRSSGLGTKGTRSGPGFARALVTLAPGSWQGPIESGYGWHLVFVDSLSPSRMPAFEEGGLCGLKRRPSFPYECAQFRSTFGSL